MQTVRARDGRRRRAPLAIAVAAALLLAISAPAAVSAHATLVSSTPADGEVLSAAPAEAVLTFDDPLTGASSFVILDGSGGTVATGAPDSSAPTELRGPLPDLATGTYQVRWTAATDDGHVERGVFRFTIATLTPAPSTPSPAATDAPTGQPAGTPAPTLTPSVAPAATPAPIADGDATGPDDGNVLIPIAVAGLLVGAGLALVLRRRGPG